MSGFLNFSVWQKGEKNKNVQPRKTNRWRPPLPKGLLAVAENLQPISSAPAPSLWAALQGLPGLPNALEWHLQCKQMSALRLLEIIYNKFI